jgi:hypothetical protein
MTLELRAVRLVASPNDSPVLELESLLPPSSPLSRKRNVAECCSDCLFQKRQITPFSRERTHTLCRAALGEQTFAAKARWRRTRWIVGC